MAVKVTKGQIWSGTILKKLMSPGVLYIFVENFSVVSKTARGWYHATLLKIF